MYLDLDRYWFSSIGCKSEEGCKLSGAWTGVYCALICLLNEWMNPSLYSSSEYKSVSMFKKSSLNFADIFPSFLIVHFLFFKRRHLFPWFTNSLFSSLSWGSHCDFSDFALRFTLLIGLFWLFSLCDISRARCVIDSAFWEMPSSFLYLSGFPSAFPLLMSFSSVVVSQTVWYCFPSLFFCLCLFFAIS